MVAVYISFTYSLTLSLKIVDKERKREGERENPGSKLRASFIEAAIFVVAQKIKIERTSPAMLYLGGENKEKRLSKIVAH